MLNIQNNIDTSEDLCFDDIDILTGTGIFISGGYICISKGKVSYVGQEPPENISVYKERKYSAKGYLVIPGLFNAHTHAAMGFFRDLGHGHTEMIEKFLFPAEKSLRAEMLEPLAWSFLYGSLLSGVTCIADHYYFVHGVGRAIDKIGMRGVIGETVADLGGAFPGGESEKRALQLLENWDFSERLSLAVAPHAADTVSESLLKRLGSLAASHTLPIHLHLSQTSGERGRVVANHQMSPVEFADRCGVLGEKTLAVHLVSADKHDFEILNHRGATVGYCPTSQIIYEKLAPVGLIRQAGLPIALGTDCPASNDGADMLTEAKFSGILEMQAIQQLRSTQPSVDPSQTNTPCMPELIKSSGEELLSTMTQVPANAFGLSAVVGSIEVGKSADLCFMKQDLDCFPVADPHSNLIYSMNSSHVRHVMVGGDFVLKDRLPTKISIQDMTESYTEAVETIKKLADFS